MKLMTTTEEDEEEEEGEEKRRVGFTRVRVSPLCPQVTGKLLNLSIAKNITDIQNRLELLANVQ